MRDHPHAKPGHLRRSADIHEYDKMWSGPKGIGPIVITSANGAQRGTVAFAAVARGGPIGTLDLWTGKWTSIPGQSLGGSDQN